MRRAALCAVVPRLGEGGGRGTGAERGDGERDRGVPRPRSHQACPAARPLAPPPEACECVWEIPRVGVLSPLLERGLMGREIQAIKISGEDRGKYREKVRRSLDVFARMLRERRFEASPSQVGVEIELNLVDEQGAPSMRNAEVLDAIADPAWATEVGQFNLEINVPPGGWRGTRWRTWSRRSAPASTPPTTKARGVGSRLVMVGILPSLQKQDVHEGTLSANARYRVLNEQIFAARGREHAHRHRRRRAAADPRRQHHPRGRLHQCPASSPGQPGCVRELLERGPGHRRACRSRWPPTPRSCSAGSCGTRPGSRCSSRPPTPGRTS